VSGAYERTGSVYAALLLECRRCSSRVPLRRPRRAAPRRAARTRAARIRVHTRARARRDRAATCLQCARFRPCARCTCVRARARSRVCVPSARVCTPAWNARLACASGTARRAVILDAGRRILRRGPLDLESGVSGRNFSAEREGERERERGRKGDSLHSSSDSTRRTRGKRARHM